MKYLMMAVVVGLFVSMPECLFAGNYVRVIVPTVEVVQAPTVRVRVKPYVYRVYSRRHSSAIIRVR